MTKPFVLIVEDDPLLSKIFTLALQIEFQTEAIMNGLAALTRLDEVQPDVVVLDLNLPGAPGRDILAKIRADARLARVPVIIASADVRQADYLREDVDIVLVKPISPVQLRELASRLCAAKL